MEQPGGAFVAIHGMRRIARLFLFSVLMILMFVVFHGFSLHLY
jgi:hypothetical protein